MCGIVGMAGGQNVTPILMEGLRRLEYRGYDSAGLAVINGGRLQRLRRMGKVQALQEALNGNPLSGASGVAHTRWATHGKPSEINAHPHTSGGIAVVHNGIIENHEALREQLEADGYRFASETDTEVIVHRINYHLARAGDLRLAVSRTIGELEGGYASMVVLSDAQPDALIAARIGTPVVVGLGGDGNLVASDVAALLPVTSRLQFLEEGDVAVVGRDSVRIFDAGGREVQRPVRVSEQTADSVDLGRHRHYMEKEIHEQPAALTRALANRIEDGAIADSAFGPEARSILAQTAGVHIVACGTSYHAGLVARYQLEEVARLPCAVDLASEYRYRSPVVPENTLFVAISQSGETVDTLAALRAAKELGYLATLAICNVAESSLTREADLTFLTRAGIEIGVASTKAFTTQLAALLMLTIVLARQRGIGADTERQIVNHLAELPGLVEQSLLLDGAIAELAHEFADKHHALFLGRGALNPVAMEGALKLKEISYIHAEAYAAGELKHGPLALVDDDMPVVAVAPNNELLAKLRSNLQEVRARGGRLFVFADPAVEFGDDDGVRILRMPAHVQPIQEPLLYTVPLQLLAYHVAVLRGTDLDQPRNLAKTVTVE
ncbi:MAG: glutamine--fructose-6-phosphate transaminase (isomerizing) [Proteobacteria bacterium]|nr:glutamine--fructose-6-phosphate transaminase (isomerizing) [Pseudomonadota bacterium]MYJ95377.1 glutamine--fructose-6-phosphate transaminase (isomerizing) [Pseudomonadota bacterium]